MKKFCILVVDDEVRILNFLRSKLKASGYEVITAGNGLEGIEQLKAQEPGMVILDLVMPEMDGIEMLKELRTFSAVPVIILTAKGSDVDRIEGLRLGADDYLPKPFNPDELVARIEAIRRRVVPYEQRMALKNFQLGDVTVDFNGRNVTVAGEQKHLNRIEWLLLGELVNNAGRLMLYDDLLTRIWGPEYRDDVQILRTCVSRLRSKLEIDPKNPAIIHTIPRTGYIIKQLPD